MKRSDQDHISHALLLERLIYFSDKGEFFYRVNRGRLLAGSRAGATKRDGRRYITLDGLRYGEHRLAWFYVTGNWPKNQIDHIDTNPINNRIENLRDVTELVNKQNMRRAPAGKKYSQLLGAQWCQQARKWKASIRVNQRIKHLGFFADETAASAAYVVAKRQFHEGCTL